jgi:SAM-dependent methyltransferase
VSGTPKIAHRNDWDSYDAYVHDQGGKARGNRDELLAHMPRHVESFTTYFTRAARFLTPGPILCLGARTGAESIGATKAGFARSVGIDLHPVGPTVIRGDWHAIPFEAATFANCYSNSLDHCLHLDKLTAEVTRVLIPGGRFYVMATNREGHTEDAWRQKPGNEALFWQTSDDLAAAICGYGFKIVQSWRDGKWGHYVLKVA